MTTTTLERTEGLSVLNQAMAAIKEKIEEKRGVFNIQMEVSERPSLLDQTAACNQIHSRTERKYKVEILALHGISNLCNFVRSRFKTD